ncbi:MAG: hypothetical protein LBG60_10825 [Bifidobacteriaceae bacterium]|jgi:hypothetical protein|nr:hypothetical protein [Bifidobacteriaceae bacterium]
MSGTAVVMPWAEWRRLFQTAEKFACQDRSLPDLCGVRVWTEPDKLLACATDRFKAVRLSILAGQANGLDAPLPKVEAWLTRPAFRVMASALSGRGRSSLPVSLSTERIWCGGDDPEVSVKLGEPAQKDGLPIPPADLVDGADELAPAAFLRLNAAYSAAVFQAADAWMRPDDKPLEAMLAGPPEGTGASSLLVVADGFKARQVCIYRTGGTP